jgi:trimethylamine-N-oxide reductase (cytochrome c)
MGGTRGDKTVLRSLGLGGLYGGGAEGMVDVKNGKILRVRPFHFDWKYDAPDPQEIRGAGQDAESA